MPNPSVVHIVIDDSTSKVITGTYQFDRTNDGKLIIPAYNGEPSSPSAGEFYWDTSTNVLYRRNDTNTDWVAQEALAALHASTHESGGDDEINHDNLVGSGTYTHAQIDTHIDDIAKHREINDSGTAATDLWSADKITSEISSFVSSFTGLSDTPSSYSGEAGKFIRVNSTPDGLEFVTLHAVATSGNHTDLSNIGTNTHAQIDTHIASSSIHFTEGSINHNSISGLQGGTTDEYYHLTSAQHTDLTDAGDSLLHYHASDRSRTNHTGIQAATTVELREISTATYDDIQDWSDAVQSAGIISGGEITDGGSGTIDISTVTGIIKSTNSPIAESYFFDLAGVTGLTLTDNSTNYIYIDYNSGTPQFGISTSNISNGHTIFNLGKVFREDTSVDIITSGLRIHDLSKRIQQHHLEESSLHFVSGAIVGETGTRNITISSGVLYAGLNRIITDAIDTSAANTFEYYYYNGSAWIESDETQIDNTQYNNIATGLSTLSNNKYGIHWVYKGSEDKTYVIYGQGDYTLVNAEAAQPPSSLPDHVENFGVLRAKIIILKSATSFLEIESVTDVNFVSTIAGNHNELSGLQGGIAGEYYHLTATTYSYINQDVTTNSSPTFSGTNFTSIPNGALSETYINANGTVGLSAAWDAGSWKITAETFESDVATGTAPFVIASTTLVSNLNSDLLDSQEGSYYLNRTNHTGTQTASTISDFDTEVSNNTDVEANTSARHNAVTVSDSTEIDFTLTGQDITASIIAGSIDETKLDTSVNASLNLADSAVQPGDLATVATSGSHTDLTNIGTNTHAQIDTHIADSSIHWADPMTTRGDIIVRDATNTTARLAVGTNGQVLTTDGTDIYWDDNSSTGGLTESSHQDLDTLLHELDEDYYLEYTRSGINITNATYWTDSGKTLKIREHQYSYTGSQITQEVVIQYDAVGSAEDTLTFTYTYDNVTLINVSSVRS